MPSIQTTLSDPGGGGGGGRERGPTLPADPPLGGRPLGGRGGGGGGRRRRASVGMVIHCSPACEERCWTGARSGEGEGEEEGGAGRLCMTGVLAKRTVATRGIPRGRGFRRLLMLP